MGGSRDIGSSFKGSSRDISGSGGSSYGGGSSHMGSSRDMGGGASHMTSSSRSLSDGRNMSGSRDMGRPSGPTEYSRSRDERAPGRSLHGSGGSSSHDVSAHSSRSNIIGSHASGGSNWSSTLTGTGGSLAADWGRSALSGDRGGMAGRSMSSLAGMSAMGMGVSVTTPFGTGIASSIPFGGSSGMAGGSMSGSGVGDRYDAYTLKNPLLGTRRY